MITGELKIKINALLRQLKVESPKSLPELPPDFPTGII